MALKFFPRQSTSLTSFLREYNLSLSYCTHPSLTRALGIFFSTPSYYVFAQQAGLYGDLYSVIVSEVSLGVCVCVCVYAERRGQANTAVTSQCFQQLQQFQTECYVIFTSMTSCVVCVCACLHF